MRSPQIILTTTEKESSMEYKYNMAPTEAPPPPKEPPPEDKEKEN